MKSMNKSVIFWIHFTLFINPKIRNNPATQKLTFSVYSKQTPQQIPHIHKDTPHTLIHTHTHTQSPRPALHCWMALLPVVAGCLMYSGGGGGDSVSVAFFCQINDAGGLVVCWRTGSITAGVLLLLAQCFSCAPLESFLPAPQSLPVTQLQINYTL